MEVDTHGNLHRKERAGKVERNEDEGQLSQASNCSPLYDCSLTFRDRHRGHQSMERSIYAHFDGLQAVGQGGASLVNLLRFFIVELNVVRGDVEAILLRRCVPVFTVRPLLGDRLTFELGPGQSASRYASDSFDEYSMIFTHHVHNNLLQATTFLLSSSLSHVLLSMLSNV
jgi:hypothetical protein